MPLPSRREFLQKSVLSAAAMTTGAPMPDDDYRRAVLAESSLLAYWPLDGDLNPVRGDAAGTPMRGEPVFVAGPVSGKVLDLANGRFVTFGSLPQLDTSEGTVELFFKLTAPSPKNYNPCLI